MDKKETYCPNCGNKIKEEGVFCSKCGTNLHTHELQNNKTNKESRAGLILANVLIPGLGHIIDGQTTKGLLILFGYIFLVAINIILAFITLFFSLLLPLSLWIYGIYDISKPEGISKKTSILFLVLISVLLVCSLVLATASLNVFQNSLGTNTTADGKFIIYNFSDTCSVELPKNIKFTDKVGDYNSNGNVAGSNVNIDSKSLFGNSDVSQITYTKSSVDGMDVGANLNDGGSSTVGGKTMYHRTVASEATGESVSVMGQNKELVDYIADHVKFGGEKKDNNKDNNSPAKKVFGYKSDGTPMYSQAEVDQYIKSKYGDVNYHIQDNGYISLDDPNYTPDGRYRPTNDYTPSPEPTPTPTPTNRTAKVVKT